MTVKRLVAILVLLGTCALAGCSDALRVETVEVQQGKIQQYIDERGKTRLPEVYLITMPYDARIEPIELTTGDEVKADQVVARVVPRDLTLAYEATDAAVQRLDESIKETTDTRVEDVVKEQAESFVVSMKSTVAAAEARRRAGREKAEFGKENYDRIKEAFSKGGSTPDELGRAELQQVESEVDYQQDLLVYEAMKSLYAATAMMPKLVDKYVETKTLARDVLSKQKLEATTQLAIEQQRQERGVMRSPVDGIVLDRKVSDERFLAAGQVLLRIGRLEDLEVEADVLSQDVGDVHIGNAVEIYGPAIGDKPAHGEVSRIYPEGFTKTSSLGVEQQRVKVIIRIDAESIERLRKERHLGVEYRVRVRMITATADNALLIPRSALFRDARAGWQVFAVAVAGGVAERRTVDVGLMNDDHAQITSGLNAGDQVVAVPDAGLEDGARVEAVKQD